jgi:endonuclease I
VIRPSSFPFPRLRPGLLCAVALFLGLNLPAAEPPGYYNSAAGLTGTALRNALHNIIDNHTVTDYSATRTPLEMLDQDPQNSANVILLYERTSWPKSQFVSQDPDGWNREHCWPNSLGIDDAPPAYSDLFNLRACGEPANADRANLYYDESSPTAAGYAIPAGPTTPLCSEDFDSWEPPLEMKGDLARAMFYMDVRYEGTSGEPNLRLTENVNLISTNANYMGRLSTLLLWNFLDPVSPAERTRLEGTYGYQGNRNPFVDRPQWVEAVYGEVFALHLAREGTEIVLSWPAILPTEIAFLESSTDLVRWTRVTLPVVDANAMHNVRVPVNNAQRFYRLKLQQRDG